LAGKQFVVDIRENQQVCGCFLVQQKTVPLNKNGKPYLALTLMDRTGQIEARMWDNVEQYTATFDVGDVVELEGSAVSYQGKLQLKANKISRLEKSSLDLNDFLPCSQRDREEMLSQLAGLIKSIENIELRRLLLEMLADREIREGLLNAPAAKSIHHSWVGGLLEHTLQVMELCQAACAAYPNRLDRDLLLAGAFLHDLGKIRELSVENMFDYTDQGRLLGHIFIGAEMLSRWAEKHPALDGRIVIKLQHLILSHHGSFEFGSPQLPKTAEALMLHYLDEMDSKLATFFEVARQEAGRRWSSYQRLFDRYFLLGEPEIGGKAKESAAKELPNTQLRDQLQNLLNRERQAQLSLINEGENDEEQLS